MQIMLIRCVDCKFLTGDMFQLRCDSIPANSSSGFYGGQDEAISTAFRGCQYGILKDNKTSTLYEQAEKVFFDIIRKGEIIFEEPDK